jgi:hypothetical protein
MNTTEDMAQALERMRGSRERLRLEIVDAIKQVPNDKKDSEFAGLVTMHLLAKWPSRIG